MKYICTLIFALISTWNATAQLPNWCDFDVPDPNFNDYFFMDTSYQNNLWQVGAPHKMVFDSAQSMPNVLITDTINTYPVNDTSIFTLKLLQVIPCEGCLLTGLGFLYQLDKDSNETAKIELSLDSGQSWTDVSIDTFNLPGVHTTSPLHMTSGHWAFYSLSLTDTPMQSNIMYLFRFSFISDSINTNKDGWEIDGFQFFYGGTSVKALNRPMSEDIYPNPSSGSIYFKNEPAANTSVRVYDMAGKEVYQTSTHKGRSMQLPLPDGHYILKYGAGKTVETSRLTIKR